MDRIDFVNGSQPGINDTNLNRLQDNIENAIKNNIVTNQEFATDEYIDGYKVYRKRIKGTWGNDNSLTISCGLSGVSYTSQRFHAFLRLSYGLFDINTPRAIGESSQNTQLYGYWDESNDQFICNSNGYLRQGAAVEVDLYYTKNNE